MQQRAARPLVALLALAALLLGVFALHCQMTGHEMHAATATSTSMAHHTDEADAVTAVSMAAVSMTAVSMAAPAVMVLASGSTDGMLDCALLALTCVLLLTLAAVVLLSRRPASYRRLLDAGGAALGVTRRTVDAPSHQPSLTQLSISRV
ncbi:hypothetical protein D6T64_19445 [Cryobacterium melibiosiphilum]|uniref:Uncharacterized protein n=2 Tax=Cryobacterium melibiosiphilum TaxID=995039 RepID=A0A3A5MJU2_9MICO|nr:hypothetical protein D6T64_19445 [Cryobacterium melibiosiphilum]